MQLRDKYPSFIIGGAPKCGTSSLYFWLAAHPDICGSKVKEPYYFDNRITRFNKSANYLEHGLSKYFDLFSHCTIGQKCFEASAGYLYSDLAIKGLQELPETPKVIFLLRYPSQQLISHYRMSRYRLNRPVKSLQAYAAKDRINLFWQYSKSLLPWLENYPNERIKVVLFEELISDKTSGMKDIAQFLDVDKRFYDNFNFEHRNESVVIKRKSLHNLGLRIQPHVPHFIQKALLPLYMKTNAEVIPELSSKDLEYLSSMRGEFELERKSLEEMLPNLSFKVWDKPTST